MNKLLRVLALICLGICFLYSAASHAQNLNVLTDLHPRPKASFLRAGQNPFILSSATRIVISDNANTSALRAAAYLSRLLRTKMGDTLAIVRASSFSGQSG